MVAVGVEVETGAASRTRRSLEEHEFNNLYARTARPLAAFIRRMTSDDDAARDFLQESYLRILRAELPPMDERELDSYVYKTASRLVQDRWRHTQVDRRWRERLPAMTEGVGSAPDVAMDMDRVLGRLRPRDRAIVWLAYVEGRSHREIAEILSLKAASVRVLLFRTRRKMAEILEAEGLVPEEVTR